MNTTSWKIIAVAAGLLVWMHGHAADRDDVASPDTGTSRVRLFRGKTTVIGPLRNQEVTRVADQREAELLKCLKPLRWRAGQTEAGSISILVHIDADGRVTYSEIDYSDLGTSNASIDRCFAAEIASWRFPRPTGPGTTSVVFTWLIARDL